MICCHDDIMICYNDIDDMISKKLTPVKIRIRHCFFMFPDFIISIIIIVDPIIDKLEEHLNIMTRLLTSFSEDILLNLILNFVDVFVSKISKSQVFYSLFNAQIYFYY